MRARLCCAVLLIAVANPAETITFRSDVNLRSVYVRVTDKKGQIVKGLPPEAFQLSENGTPQKIAFVQRQGDAMSLAVLLDVSSSMRDGRKLQEARSALHLLTA